MGAGSICANTTERKIYDAESMYRNAFIYLLNWYNHIIEVYIEVLSLLTVEIPGFLQIHCTSPQNCLFHTFEFDFFVFFSLLHSFLRGLVNSLLLTSEFFTLGLQTFKCVKVLVNRVPHMTTTLMPPSYRFPRSISCSLSVVYRLCLFWISCQN